MPIHQIKPHKQPSLEDVYESDSSEKGLPKYSLPEERTEPQVAYSLIHDELLLDGNSRQNLATFCTTWVEDEAKQLMTDAVDKNMIDKDESLDPILLDIYKFFNQFTIIYDLNEKEILKDKMKKYLNSIDIRVLRKLDVYTFRAWLNSN